MSNELTPPAGEEKKDNKKKWIALLLLLLALITGVILFLNRDTAEPEPTVSPSPSPSATATATVEPTPEPTVEPVKDFNVSVDGINYTSKDTLKKATDAPGWVNPIVVCTDYDLMDFTGVEDTPATSYYTDKSKIDPKYTKPPTEEYAAPACMDIMVTPEKQREELGTTGSASGGGTPQVFPFEEYVLYSDKYLKTQGSDEHFFYMAMSDYQSKYYWVLGHPEEKQAIDECMPKEEVIASRKSVDGTYVFSGGCQNLAPSSAPQEYEVIKTAKQEEDYRAGYTLAEKLFLEREAEILAGK